MPIRTKICSVVVASLVAGSAYAQNESPYADLAIDMADFENVSNREINDILFDAIYSGDMEIARTVLFLTSWATSVIQSDRDSFHLEYALRRIDRIPGMRNELFGCISNAPKKLAPAKSNQCQSPPETIDTLLECFPTRLSCLNLAAVYFPADLPRLRDLAPEAFNNASAPENSEQDISRLGLGDPLAASGAARRLAMRPSEESLQALATGLTRRDWALPPILDAIAMHGAMAKRLLPQLKELEQNFKSGDGDSFSLVPTDHVQAVTRTIATIETAAAGIEMSGAEKKAYRTLSDDILDFERYDNRETNDIVFRGIHSTDASIVSSTLRSVGASVLNRILGENELRGNTKQRLFKRVPGLFDSLHKCTLSGLSDMQKGEWEIIIDRSLEKAKDMPTAGLCLTALAGIFPGHPWVEAELLGALEENPANAPLYLILLNLAGIRTNEANQMRVTYLRNTDIDAARIAAQGLGLSQTEAGLDALAKKLSRGEPILPEIVQAVAMHGAMAEPHLQSLRKLNRDQLAPDLGALISQAITTIETAHRGKPDWQH